MTAFNVRLYPRLESVSANSGGSVMPEVPSPYQVRAFFARNAGRSFSIPELKKRFGDSVQGHVQRLSQEGYLNTVLKYGMPFYELAER